MSAEFRFSPRFNRAGDIAWRPWGEAAFDEARALVRPVFLDLSAVWCHWCHVLDETTLSDERVIRLLNERFVPVRCDADRHPEVETRYLDGGWPTTAFLTPSGEVLSSATYVPPDEFVRWAEAVADAYDDRAREIETKVALHQEALRAHRVEPPSGAVSTQLVAKILEGTRYAYDNLRHGFGTGQKFPMSHALSLLLRHACGRYGDEHAAIARNTLLAMYDSELRDPVEGGFFRYCTGRDWTAPHFEKMATVNAELLACYVEGYLVLGEERFLSAAREIVRWVMDVARDPQGGFAGSQDADEAYYALRSAEERRAVRPPYVDRTLYTDRVSQTAAALLLYSDVAEDENARGEALRALERVWAEAFDPEVGLAHCGGGDGWENVGNLTDAAWFGWALLAANRSTGDGTWLVRARTIVDRAIAGNRDANGGGFFDREGTAEYGRLLMRVKPLDANAVMVRVLARLAELVDDSDYRTVALDAARSFSGLGRFGVHAALMGIAADELSRGLDAIVIADSGDGGADKFARAALRSWAPASVLVRLKSGGRHMGVAYPAGCESCAFVCSRRECLAPAGTESELAAAIRKRTDERCRDDVAITF